MEVTINYNGQAVAVEVTEYFPAWEPSVSRLRAIKKFLPSEPLLPQDIVKGLCQ